MGIQGLLPLLKSIHKPCSLKKFAGQTIGVDAYGWLHRGTVACAMELAMDRPTRKFVDFAMHRVRMLQYFGVVPFLVFDGDYLPSKAATEADRSKRREESKRLGLELLNAGKTSQAYLELQKAIDVTPEMARQLIDELRKAGVQYVVAPYEADAQLVYLERKGLVAGVLSEDSDLLVFGAKCLLTKLDQHGNCIEINKADFCACRDINLTGWSDTEFRQMAILSGCDYLSSINNMGLKTAYRMIRKHKTIEKVLRMLQFDGKFHVPKGYLEAFHQAELTFLHQWVYCPRSKTLVFHTQPHQAIDAQEMPFIGTYVEPDVAGGVAAGDLNPMTKQLICVKSYDALPAPRNLGVASRSQSHQMATTEGSKKGVSIAQFFKAKRVPLAELDPNCFTPSPTQQGVLSRNPDSWPADLVPRPYLRRSTTEVASQLPQSAPFIMNRGSTPRITPVSGTRPPKRTRLCSEDPLLDTVKSAQESNQVRSPFFSSTMADPSPSVGRSTKIKRSKREDIGIFSDDSIEEALLSLPDYDGWHKVKPKNDKAIPIFDDEAAKIDVGLPSELNSPRDESEQKSTADVSQNTMPKLIQPSSASSSVDEPPTPSKSPVPQAFSCLTEKFKFNSPVNSSVRRNFHGLATPPSSVKQSRIPRAIKHSTLAVVNSVKEYNLTPLQSLGVKALNRPLGLPMTPQHTPPTTTGGRVKSIQRTEARRLADKGVPFPEVGQSAMLRVPIDTVLANVTLPVSSKDVSFAQFIIAPDAVATKVSNGVKAIGSGRGSEDLIIHDSEEESDAEIVQAPENVGGVSKMSLEKFVFQG